MSQPPAEVAPTVEDVDRLLAAQYPALRGPLRLVANGWDNEVFRLGEDLAVRLPRRAAAAALIEHEQRWLPEIAPRLPLPVPVPVAVGRPGPGCPWHWSVVPWFAGRRALDVPAVARDGFAGALGGFLRALHTGAPADAPVNPVRGVALASRDDAVRARLATGSAVLRAAWNDALAAPAWAGSSRWVHGDVHPGNLVVDDEGRLAAVIDFGDLCGGDPACDLAIAWTGFTASGRRAFRAALGDGCDDAMWRRARGWAASMASLVHDDPAMRAMTVHTIAQLADG